ncbi:MAG: pyridoxal phosphate-dependent aminotransferase [Armatimonadota bacterium]
MAQHRSTEEACLHGGASFAALGDAFERLGDRPEIINADVLDAWFPPAPAIIEGLRDHLAWALRTSPPTGCEGMIRTIARVRGVPPECVLPGGGSSDLIFLALRDWLTPDSRVLLPDPAYGEYAHVLERVIGCRPDRLPLERAEGYALPPDRLAEALRRRYDLVVLVNPNSPTGRHLRREELEPVLAGAPAETRFWLDETYVEYAGADQSLERFAVSRDNVVVCKSMSKVYALSGARAAYLCAPERVLRPLRRETPPWAVSLIGQIAAVKALESPDYYAARYAETHALRGALAEDLAGLGLEVMPSDANFLLCHLPEGGLTGAEVERRCRERGLFLRNAGSISHRLGNYAIRLAVKDGETNRRMLEILGDLLSNAA